MKILIVCQYYYPENFVISKIAEKFALDGHDVTVLTGRPNYGYGKIMEGYENIKYENINGVNVHRLRITPRKKSRLSIIRNYLSFWYLSKKWVKRCKTKFDIVYSMSLSPVTILSAGNLYKRKHKVPHVVHCVDLWPESVLVTNAVKKNSLAYKILFKWSQNLYQNVDKILIGSPSFKDYFNAVLKIKNKPLIYIPQPSLIENPIENSANTFHNGFNVLYCGNLGEIQLIELLPKVAEKFKDSNVKFHIIGMGPKTEFLLKKIIELSLDKTIFYYGPMSALNASKYYSNCDAVYISLKNCGYVGKTIPNKLVMAMAFSKPIIGVLSGDGKKIILDSQGDFVCEENIDQIAENIKKMSLLSRDELNKLGLNNRQYFENNFETKKITEIIEKELLELL